VTAGSPEGGPLRARSKRDKHLIVAAMAVIVGLVALAFPAWEAWGPKYEPLSKKARPPLVRLDAANQSLSEALAGLRAGSRARLALERSRASTSVLATAQDRIEPMGAEKDPDEELKGLIMSMIRRERTYLRAVSAFLRREPTKHQERQLWRYSERLRTRLDDVRQYVSAVRAQSVRGAGALSAWYRRETGSTLAVSQLPPSVALSAERQMERAPTGTTKGGTRPECRDGSDNDDDGFIDHPRDPDCASANDDSEAPPGPTPAACANGRDDDDDGRTDFGKDPDCESKTDTTEAPSGAPPTGECVDKTDNDDDMLPDEADPGCAMGSRDRENADG
jgi:hypothetical protein